MQDQNASDDSVTLKKNKISKRHISKRLVVLIILVVGAFGYCGWRYHRIVKAPLDVSKATKTQALSWFALRDLSSESEEKRSELFDYYYRQLTSGSGELTDGASVEIPSSLQSVASSFLKNADQKVESWSKKRVRPPFARIDYVVKLSEGDHPSKYVLSSDVKPGPGLKKRWQERQVAVARGAAKTPVVERNVQMMLMQWFVDRSKRYDAVPDAKKKELLERYADELVKLQGLYNKFRVSGGQTQLARSLQLREFERANEGWLEFATLDELAKTMWFKDLITSVIVLKEAGIDGSRFYPPTIKKKAPTSDAEAKRPVDRALDAAKRYFFVEKTPEKAPRRRPVDDDGADVSNP